MKTRLLAAAEAVFVHAGLDGAKVDDITERAGVSKGSFYLHFEKKEDAFRELIEAMVARLATYLDSIPEECGTDFSSAPQFLDHWVSEDAQIFEFVWQNRGLMGLLLEGGQSAAYRHLIDEFLERARLKIRRFLERGITQGLYRADLELDVTSGFMAGAYDQLSRRIVREPRKPDIHRLLREVQLLILRGIASAPILDELATASGNAVPTINPNLKGQS